jgi:O-antigen ligase
MPAAPVSPPAWLSIWMSASASLFYLLMLTVFSGYSLGAALLFLGGLMVWVADRRAPRGAAADVDAPWSREDRTLCWLLLAVFAVNALAVVWHGDESKYLDQGSRYLLAIPIVYGLRRVSLRLNWMVAALVLGTVGAAAIAWWQINFQEFNRASGFVTSAIPFGDMALTMGFWCLMAAAWAAIRGRRGWAVLLLLSGLAGGYAMVASATRGSLLAVPFLVVLATIALLRRRHLRPLLAGGAVVLVGLAIVLAMMPAGKFADGRYIGALTEWQEYSDQGEVANNTVGPRLEAWKAAFLSIPERPILGWGHLQYDAHLRDLIAAGRVNPFVDTLSNTHNNFLEIWLHQGTLGLLAIVTLLAASFWSFARRLRSPDLLVRVLACCGASLPASFAAYGLTQVILGRNNGVMFFLVSLAALWAVTRAAEAGVHDRAYSGDPR